MKQIAAMLMAMTAFLVVAATPALAGYAPPPPPPGGIHGGAGTAFTGSDLSVGIVLLGVLVIGGLAALLISRRRTAARN
jgi:LPXTG-motif cell wall-anchored protein